MPEFKFSYFNVKGQGEVARWMLLMNDADWEDIRVNRAEWPKHKPDAPFGQLPVLEFDGMKICQSNAIQRFLANKFGLMGSSPLESAKVDMIVDCVEDINKTSGFALREQDPDKKAGMRKKFEEEQLPQYLSLLEKLLEANEGGNGFFVGDKMSWADLYFAHWVDWLAYAIGKWTVAMEKCPKLEALKKKVESQPKIADWLEKRGPTEMDC